MPRDRMSGIQNFDKESGVDVVFVYGRERERARSKDNTAPEDHNQHKED